MSPVAGSGKVPDWAARCFADHPLPWTWDSEVDKTLTDETARAYSAEPVIRDANERVVLDLSENEMGAYERIVLAEAIVCAVNGGVT